MLTSSLVLVLVVLVLAQLACSGVDDTTQCLADEAVELEDSAEDRDAVERFLNAHDSFPIVMLCHKRTDELRKTLLSLGRVKGFDPRVLVVVQDGKDEQVARIVRDEFRLALVQGPGNHASACDKPQCRIARQLKFGIDTALERFEQAPMVILVEDDMLFSPDFIQFFNEAGRLVARDRSLWTASAWHDNSFREHAASLRKNGVMRTDHFPGLGWLMTRRMWTSELRNAWPEGHFDWFLRDPATTRGRECVHPELSRVFHHGVHGSFMNEKLHEMYFENVAWNQDASFEWARADLERAHKQAYDARFAHIVLHQAIHVGHGEELSTMDDARLDMPWANFVVWHRSNPDPRFETKFRPLSRCLGIWHQMVRGARKGVHVVRVPGRAAKLVLINVFDPAEVRGTRLERKRAVWSFGFATQTPWASLRPPWVRVFASGRDLAREMGAVCDRRC